MPSAPRSTSPEQDGLRQVWAGVCWCNLPYGRAIAAWVQKAYEASKAGALVACLLPSRTGPSWWQTYVLPYAEIRFLPKRQKFSGKGSAPFDSAVAIFRPIPSAAESDQRLLDRLRWGKWSTDELQWLVSHLAPGISPQIVLVGPVGAQPVLKVLPRPADERPAPPPDAPAHAFSYESSRRHTVGLFVDGPDGHPFVMQGFETLQACEWARALALKRPESPPYVCAPLPPTR